MNEEQKLLFNFGGITFFAGMLIGVLIGFSIGRASLPNLSGGADTVGKQLNQAQSTAQSVTNSISTAQGTAGEIRQTSQDIGTTIDSIQGTLISSGDSIENCERILAGIRARGKVKAIKN